MERVQDLGTPGFLFLAISCTKNELLLLNQYIITIQNGDSQISMSINMGPQLDCLHRPDRCLTTCSNSPLISKVSLVHIRKSGLSIQGLTLRNGPKSMDFYQNDGRYSIAPASTHHHGISIPRRLAYKRSNSQPTNT